MIKKSTLRFDLFWVLVIFTPLFMGLILAFKYNPVLEFQALALAAFGYLIFAFLHHYKSKTLRLEVMVEYILIAALALIILQSLLF